MNSNLKVRKMNHCNWCSLSEEDKQFQVYESESWSVFLSDEQDYIGRCILMLKRHCNAMAELTDDEWDDFRDVFEDGTRHFYNKEQINDWFIARGFDVEQASIETSWFSIVDNISFLYARPALKS